MARLDQLQENPEKHMGFLDHLEEFRWHLMRMALALVLAMVFMFVNLDFIIGQVILGPMQPDFVTFKLMCQLSDTMCLQGSIPVKLQATSPSEQFTRAILIAFVGGLVLAFPYLVWELWRFVKPGLLAREIRSTRGIVGIISSLFLVGVGFGYFIISPFTLNFFSKFQLAAQVENIWQIGEVISLIVQISLAGGILFEMPVAAYMLSKLGVLHPAVMRRYRRHAVVVNLVVAGILTPSPDLMSQLLLAIPMMLLYEVSIVISARVARKRLQAEAAAQKQ